jgi:hypothetical protein
MGFIDNLRTQTRDYTLQITVTQSKSFPASNVFTSSCLVTASNNGYSSASVLKSSLNGSSLPAFLSFPFVQLISPRHGPLQRTPFPTVPL